MTARRAASLLLAALAASCGGPDAPAEVRVFAASSLTEVMQTIAADFEKDTGAKVKLNLASSSVLAKQIVEGAPCDVFLSADQEWADFVEKEGLVVQGSRRDLLTNDLAVVFPRGREEPPGPGPTSPDLEKEPESHRRAWIRAQLTDPTVRRIAIGDPAHVPAGRYTKRTLEEWGLWKEIEHKTVGCENVRAALALVERAEVDAGIVYETDRRVSTKVKSHFWLLDGIEYDVFNTGQMIYLPRRVPNPMNPIRYPAMRIHPGTDAGYRFDQYLSGAGAGRVFQAAGFGVPSPPK